MSASPFLDSLRRFNHIGQGEPVLFEAVACEHCEGGSIHLCGPSVMHVVDCGRHVRCGECDAKGYTLRPFDLPDHVQSLRTQLDATREALRLEAERRSTLATTLDRVEDARDMLSGVIAEVRSG